MRVKAFDRLNADDAFMLGLVRKHRRSRHVSDRINSRNIRLVELIDDDDPAIGFDAKFFQPKVLDISDDANGRDDALERGRLRLAALLDGGGHAVGLLVELGHLRAGVDLDALLFKTLARKSLNLLILDWKNLRQYFDDCHFRTKRPKERSELNSDGSRTDH